MNNTKILQKCVDALSKDSPDISYIKGMLETLIELSPVVITPIPTTTTYDNNFKADEEEIPEFLKPGPIGKLR